MAPHSHDRSMTSPEADKLEPEPNPSDAASLDAVSPAGGVTGKNGSTPGQGLVTLEEETRRRLEAESTLQVSEARYRLLYDNTRRRWDGRLRQSIRRHAAWVSTR